MMTWSLAKEGRKMPEQISEGDFLSGKEVAFTGRLASMTRAEAVKLIRAHGGQYVPTVSKRTAFLVVGQDGWPLQKDGRLTNKLRKVRSLRQAGSEVSVLSEEELFSRIGLTGQAEGIRRLYTTAELSRLLNVSGDRLRRWLRAGLIEAVEVAYGVNHFDYCQVVGARTLCELIATGVSPERLRRSMQQLQAWIGNSGSPILQLATLEKNGELLVRLEDGLAEPGGQRCFDFDISEDHAPLQLTEPTPTVEEWLEVAEEHEEGGRWENAVDAYRQALQLGGPTASTCFNLANTLQRLDRKEQAIERYYQAVELEPTFADAWNNLGVVLSELHRTHEAIAAFERALALQPHYADAHYNIADLLDETGQEAAARSHWKAYLAQDAHSEWARHAQRRLIGERA
jgi:tetratricopeptide (TPR) repeat protein